MLGLNSPLATDGGAFLVACEPHVGKTVTELGELPFAISSLNNLLLACDKPMFDMPIDERVKLKSGELSTWVRLVTATAKRAIADADQNLCETNHSITAFLAAARPDPLTTDELVNELSPAPRMRPQIPLSTIFSFLFRVASHLAHANCAHAAHAGLSQVQVSRGGGGGDEAAKWIFDFISLLVVRLLPC
jgi:hypothetical protein